MEAEPITVTVPAMSDVALHKYVLELQPRIGYSNDTGDSLFAKLYRTEEAAVHAAKPTTDLEFYEELRTVVIGMETGTRHTIQTDGSPMVYANLYRTAEDALAAAHTHTGYIVTVVVLCVFVLILLYVILKSPNPLV